MYFIFISLLIYLFNHFFDKYNLQNDENAHLVTKVVFRIGMHCTDHLLLSVTVLGEMEKNNNKLKGQKKKYLILCWANCRLVFSDQMSKIQNHQLYFHTRQSKEAHDCHQLYLGNFL